MSIRYIPPPPRAPRYFDEGDLPLSSKAIEEDAQILSAPSKAAIYLQPLFDDPSLPQIVTTILDEDVWQQLTPNSSNQNLVISLSDDEVSLPAAIDDEPIDFLNLFPLRLRSHVIAQPIAIQDSESGAKNFFLDEDGYLNSALRKDVGPIQSLYGDDDFPHIVVTIVDEDGVFIATTTIAVPFLQPYADDGIGTQLFIPALDEEGNFIAWKQVQSTQPQPANAEDVGGAFSNFALDEDSFAAQSPQIGSNACIVSVGDDSPLIVVVTIVDEDGVFVGSARLALSVSSQPIASDDEIVPKSVALDEEFWNQIAPILAKVASKVFSDDETLPNAKNLGLDDDQFSVWAKQPSTAFAAQLFDSSDLHVQITQSYRGSVVRVASNSGRIVLTFSDNRIKASSKNGKVKPR